MSDDADIRARSGPPRRTRFGGLRIPGGAAARRPRFRVGAVVAVAVAAGLVAWLVLRDDGGSSSARTQAGAIAMKPAAIATLAQSVGHPIYWLGPMRDTTYEVTQAANGKIYVRYLPSGVDVGSPKQYLTVATYPFPGTYAVIRKQARVKGAVTARLAGGGVAVLDAGYPQSVHIGYPQVDHQIEVYDPTPARAMQLVSSGQLASIGSPAATTAGRISTKPTAATRADLQTFAQRVGHPIYWAGPKPGYTYELSTTSNGGVFIRYLPAGAKVGDPRADFLTVATYPFPGAFAAVTKDRHGRGRRRHHQARARRDRRRRRELPEEHPPRLPGSELPDRGLRPVSERRPQTRRLRRDLAGPVAQGRRGAELAAVLDRLSARPRAALARLRPARGAGVWTQSAGPAPPPARPRFADRRGQPRHDARSDRPARGPARGRARGRWASGSAPDARGSTRGRSESRSRSSPSTPPRSSSPGRPRSPATSRSTTPRRGWRSPIG